MVEIVVGPGCADDPESVAGRRRNLGPGRQPHLELRFATAEVCLRIGWDCLGWIIFHGVVGACRERQATRGSHFDGAVVAPRGQPSEVAELLPHWLKEYDLVMLRGHGPFAIGHLLEEAYQLTSVLEMTCRILTISEGMGGEVKYYRKGSERYGSW
ncbi:MAG TPA: class II aldolase/adducin family protein [Thermoleophilia bacterium]|nr:class II aldolase/adducin family protein [Thermoleophilia bacterium]HQG54486.1 class II aldolase/adducin family protein [Thermoleophilia bacterium]